MSCQMTLLSHFQNISSVKNFLFQASQRCTPEPETAAGANSASEDEDTAVGWDEDWGSWNEREATPECTAQEMEVTEDPPNGDRDYWLQECILSLSPLNDIMAIAHKDRIVLLTQKWDPEEKVKDIETRFTPTWQCRLGQEGKETITSVLCLPLASQKRSTQGGPDWTCVIVGFSSGYVRMYTEMGTLLLSQLLHLEPVQKLKCRTYESPRYLGIAEQHEELVILYKKVLAYIDGFSLFQSLRACRNQVARATASGNESALQPPPLAYKKWGLQDQVRIQEAASCGVHTPTVFDQMRSASCLGGFSATVKPTPPAASVYVSVGDGPYVGFFYAHEGSTQPILSEVAYAVAHKLKSAIMSAASGWLGFGNKKNEEEEQRPKIEPGTPLSHRFSLPDKRRVGLSLALSPNNMYVATTDSFGRVMLVDIERGIAVRMWKGYRDAQLGWIQVSEDPGHGSHRKENCKVAHYLVIYATRRGILEIWTAASGPRVAAFNVSKSCVLVSPGYGMMGLNNVTARGVKMQVFQCALVDSEGTVKTIDVPFHLALSDKNNKRSRDLHLLRKIKSLLKESTQETDDLYTKVKELLMAIKISDIRKQGVERIMNTKYLTSTFMQRILSSCIQNLHSKQKCDGSLDLSSRLLLKFSELQAGLLNVHSQLDKHNNQGLQLVQAEDDSEILLRLLDVDQEEAEHIVSEFEHFQSLLGEKRDARRVQFEVEDMNNAATFLECFQCLPHYTDKESNHSKQVEMKANLPEHVTLSLGEYFYSKSLSRQSSTNELAVILQDSGLPPGQLMSLLMTCWLSGAGTGTSLGAIQSLYQTIRTIICMSNFTDMRNEIPMGQDFTSDWWQKIRDGLCSSCNISAAYLFAVTCRGVAREFLGSSSEASASAKDPDADMESYNSEKDSGSDWENLAVDMEHWNLLVRQLEDVLSINGLLQIRLPSHNVPLTKDVEPVTVSVKKLLEGGKGAVPEVTARYVARFHLLPDHLFQTKVTLASQNNHHDDDSSSLLHTLQGNSLHTLQGKSLHTLQGNSLHTLQGKSLHTLQGKSLHTLQGNSLHTLQGNSLHTLQGKSLHTLQGNSLHTLQGKSLHTLQGNSLHTLQGKSLHTLQGKSLHTLQGKSLHTLQGKSLHTLQGKSLHTLQGKSLHTLQGKSLHTLQGKSLHTLQGNSLHTLQGNSLHTLQGNSLHTLQGNSLHTLQGNSLHTLQGNSLHTLQGNSLHTLQGNSLHTLQGYKVILSTRYKVILLHTLQGNSLHTLQGNSLHTLQGNSLHTLQGNSLHTLQGNSLHTLQGNSLHTLQGNSLHTLQGNSLHTLQGNSLHTLQGNSLHTLQGNSLHTLQGNSLHTLQGNSLHTLQGNSLHTLQGNSLHTLQGNSLHTLQGNSLHTLQGNSLHTLQGNSLHTLQGNSLHTLQGNSLHTLQGNSLHTLQGNSLHTLQGNSLHTLQGNSLHTLQGNSLHTLQGNSLHTLQGNSLHTLQGNSLHTLQGNSLHTLQGNSLHTLQGNSLHTLQGNSLHTLQGNSLHTLQGNSLHTLQGNSLHTLQGNSLHTLQGNSLHTLQGNSLHTLQGNSLHTLQGNSLHTLQGNSLHTLQGNSLHTLQGNSLHTLQGNSLHTLQGNSLHTLQGNSLHTLQGNSLHTLQGNSLHTLQGNSLHTLQGNSLHTLQGNSLHTLQGQLEKVRHRFPHSLESDVLLTNSCWEYTVQWNRDPENITDLHGALNFLKLVQNAVLRQGVGSMMWHMFLVKRMSSAAHLMEKVGKAPKDRLCRKDVGMSCPSLLEFMKAVCQLLKIIMEANCEVNEVPVFNMEPLWTNVNGPASLVELAIDQRPTNYGLLHHHLHLGYIMQAILEFGMKSVKVLSLFDNKGRHAFFQDLYCHPLLPTSNVDQTVSLSRRQFLSRVVSQAVQTLDPPFIPPVDSPSLPVTKSKNTIATEWPAIVLTIAKDFDLDIDFFKRQHVCELFSGGHDALTEEILQTVNDHDLMGSQLLLIAGQRVALHLLQCDVPTGVDLLTTVSPVLSTWLKSLDCSSLRCKTVDLKDTALLIGHVVNQLTEGFSEYNLAISLLDLVQGLQ
ncbi:hypothetical protein ScPMuIL_014036 [Solemya velum]